MSGDDLGFIPEASATAQGPQAPIASAAAPTSDDLGFQPLSHEEQVQEKYGTIGQQVKAGLEGIAKGVLGPIPAMVQAIPELGVKAEDVKGREEANPITHGLGEATGLIGSTLLGTGLGGAMTKAGKAAEAAAGLGKATYGARVSSEAIKQAAEMAVMQGSDEVAKQILRSPDEASENAIANIGLATAIGAGGGAFFAGAASPLWKATVGSKAADELLGMISNRAKGGAKLVLPETREAALKELNIEADPVIRSALSDDAKSRQFFSDLRRGENPEALQAIDNIRKQSSEAVAKAMNLSPDDVLRYDANEAGHSLFDTFQKEYKTKYQPIADQFERRAAEASGITLSDEAKLDMRDQLLERAMTKLRPGSEYGKIYEKYADELLPLDNLGHLDELRSEIFNKTKGAQTDYNVVNALHDIRNLLGDFQEQQIASKAADIAKMGIKEGVQEGENLIVDRSLANTGYKNFAKMSNELSNHLGVGEFKGFGTLTSKLENKITPEQLLKKFSIKNNADLIPFLQANFPETLDAVLANERQLMIKPAVLRAAKQGETPIDINELHKIISKQMSERSSYVDAVLPKDTMRKVEAAKTLLDAIPSPRDSGTPGGMKAIFKHIPTSALAAIGWMTGHNPIVGAILGETASKLGIAAPEAYKLGYLRFLSSDQPIKSEAFKAMVDFMHNTYKGENTLAKATKAVFKGGAQVLSTSAIPDQDTRDKIDKAVTRAYDNPNRMVAEQSQGDLGHYLPDHQIGVTKATAQITQYLNGLKPRPLKLSPLDKEIPPSGVDIARYNRALDIAAQPALVMQHIKNGTLQPNDIVDLKSMYPNLYTNLASKLSNEMVNMEADHEDIPYKTKVSMSLFLGQPLDSTMTPTSIMAAQPQRVNSPIMNNGNKPSKGSPSALKGKTIKMAQTPMQGSELDKSSRD